MLCMKCSRPFVVEMPLGSDVYRCGVCGASMSRRELEWMSQRDGPNRGSVFWSEHKASLKRKDERIKELEEQALRLTFDLESVKRITYAPASKRDFLLPAKRGLRWREIAICIGAGIVIDRVLAVLEGWWF